MTQIIEDHDTTLQHEIIPSFTTLRAAILTFERRDFLLLYVYSLFPNTGLAHQQCQR